jgi:hypothetical protein
MPLHLRHFIFNEIKSFYDEENKAYQKTPKNSSNSQVIYPGPPKSTPTKKPSSPKKVSYK